MRWALNSSKAVLASELRAHLDGEVAHHEKTLLRRFARNLLNNEEPTARGPQDDEVLRQMKAGINAACSLAECMGPPSTLFNVTLSGHIDLEHAHGVDERMVVSVDVAAPPRVPPEPMPGPQPPIAG